VPCFTVCIRERGDTRRVRNTCAETAVRAPRLQAKKLQEMTGAKNIKLKPEVDESLLGGFVVQYGKDGSGYIDMSIKGQLEKLATEMGATVQF